MKFILDEKFSLDKIIEKFILTEDEETSGKDELTELSNKVLNAQDSNQVKGAAKAFVEKAEELIKNTGAANKYKDLSKQLDKIRSTAIACNDSILDETKDKIKEYFAQTNEVLNDIKKEQQKNKQQSTQQTTTQKTSTNRDWDAEFSAAVTDTKKSQQLWNEFFTSTWGENAQRARNLGEALYQELKEYGYDRESNFFITFVDELFKNGIFPDKDHYGTIHNLFVQDKLNVNDISEQNYVKHTLITNKSLYTKSIDDIDKYIQQSNNVIKNFNSKKLKGKFDDTFYNGAGSLKKLYNNIFFTNGQGIDLDKGTVNDVTVTSDTPLASIGQVTKTVGLCIGKENAVITSKPDFDISALKRYIDTTAKPQETAENVIKYLIVRYSSMTLKDVKLLTDTYKFTTTIDIASCVDIENNLKYDIDESNVLKYVDTIAKEYKFVASTPAPTTGGNP